MLTVATGLTGVPGINLDDLNSLHSRFVGHKRVQLGKRPAMKASFLLLPVFLAQKLTRRGHGWTRQAQVHTDDAVEAMGGSGMDTTTCNVNCPLR